MKKTLFALGFVTSLYASAALAVSAGTVATDSVSRGAAAYTSSGTTNTVNRGYQGLANVYQQHQRNTYYMVPQPDVDAACR